jgi:phosphoenolpyruvate carboxylase
MARSRTVRATVEFRNPLTIPLNRMQVRLMDLYSEVEDAHAYQEAMLQTIAGLAAAMQSTG